MPIDRKPERDGFVGGARAASFETKLGWLDLTGDDVQILAQILYVIWVTDVKGIDCAPKQLSSQSRGHR